MNQKFEEYTGISESLRKIMATPNVSKNVIYIKIDKGVNDYEHSNFVCIRTIWSVVLHFFLKPVWD